MPAFQGPRAGRLGALEEGAHSPLQHFQGQPGLEAEQKPSWETAKVLQKDVSHVQLHNGVQPTA